MFNISIDDNVVVTETIECKLCNQNDLMGQNRLGLVD